MTPLLDAGGNEASRFIDLKHSVPDIAKKLSKNRYLMERHKTGESGVLLYEKREDELLMAQYALGDEAAFRELYRRYRARAYGYLNKRISDPGVADELFQQVFLKLHRSRSQYEAGRLFSAWFFTICRSVLIDHFRRRGKSGVHEVLSEKHSLSSDSVVDSTRELIPEGILASLSEKQREAVRLRYEQELAFGEIAKTMNTTQENVRQLISRGIRKLKKVMGKNGPF